MLVSTKFIRELFDILCPGAGGFLLAETMPYQQRGQYLQPNYRGKVYTWPSCYHTLKQTLCHMECNTLSSNMHVSTAAQY
jgi:hypothetical protein